MSTIKELNRKIINKQNELYIPNPDEERNLIIIATLLWKEVCTLKKRYNLIVNVKKIKLFEDFITVIKKLIRGHEKETDYEIAKLTVSIGLVKTNPTKLYPQEKEFYLEVLNETLVWLNRNASYLIKSQILNSNEDLEIVRQAFTKKIVELENTSRLLKTIY